MYSIGKSSRNIARRMCDFESYGDSGKVRTLKLGDRPRVNEAANGISQNVLTMSLVLILSMLGAIK